MTRLLWQLLLLEWDSKKNVLRYCNMMPIFWLQAQILLIFTEVSVAT